MLFQKHPFRSDGGQFYFVNSTQFYLIYSNFINKLSIPNQAIPTGCHCDPNVMLKNPTSYQSSEQIINHYIYYPNME